MCIILASTSSLTRAIVKNHIPIKKENIIVNVYICIGLYCPASAEQTNLSTYVKTPRSTKVPVVCNHQTKYVLYCTGLGLYLYVTLSAIKSTSVYHALVYCATPCRVASLKTWQC